MIALTSLILLATNLLISRAAQLEVPGVVEEHKDEVVRLVLLNDEHSKQQIGTGSNMTPVVFWHGMGDTAYGSINIERLALEAKFPGMKVFSIQVGKNILEDELAGYFTNVNQQIKSACEAILNNTFIKQHGAFNGVGFSQGAQFLRGLVQRCPFRQHGIRVKNLISLGGQHQGVYGLPNCPSKLVCDYVRYLLTKGAYEQEIQEHLVQAEYWHDPLNEEQYRAKNIFIADINNERNVNQSYKANLLALENLVLVKFNDDDMVVPRESSLFGFYEPGGKDRIIPMANTKLYREDRIGIKEMNESGRLHLIEVPGRHLQYRMKWFMDNIAGVYLAN